MTPADYRYPFDPFPTGWYQLGAAADLAPGALVSREFAGKEIVLYRTMSGEARACGAYCPHMGAHFGHGGRVDGEEIWCPFHGFCFDGAGNCTKTGYDTTPPKTAKLDVIPLVELHGRLFGYHDSDGAAPRFDLPAVSEDGWSPLKFHTFHLRGHPQETTENSVDVGHLSVVHGYTDLETLSRLKVDGDYLTVRYAMQRPMDWLGNNGSRVRAEFTIHVWGLGYSRVEVDIPDLGLRSRHLVFATPLDGDRIELTVGVAIEDIEPARVHRALGLVPRRLFRRAVLEGVFRAYVHDVAQDLDIWENKAYVHPAQVARGDGPIGRYRTWARRFYPQGSPPQSASPPHLATA